MFRHLVTSLPSSLRSNWQAIASSSPSGSHILSSLTDVYRVAASHVFYQEFGQVRHHNSAASTSGGSEETITVTFVDKEGKDHTVKAPIGKNLLEVAHDNEVDLEGACEASLACSTCHVIVENEEYFKRLPEPSEDELDMLDLAFGLTETSRLGCQVIASRELDGLRVRIPAASRNFYVDGHKPKPH
mmetsp:Transcript_8866/g.18936  ORF Transcript_8866/g.18936 Transcript_8866/m.18936 type:complete len:187 (+) Transcript_8866:58-618(+)